MKVLIANEVTQNESRIAAIPQTVKKMIQMGLDVWIESNAGTGSMLSDRHFSEAGGVLGERNVFFAQSDIILKVQPLSYAELELLKENALVVSFLNPSTLDSHWLKLAQEKKITYFSMNFIPRITRAQKMDALSSQSNLMGYKAVLLAANLYPGLFPLMMTAAGTVTPARVFVFGAGVAGLQAIATARRLGAVVEATDVRASAKEQVESLGAKFVVSLSQSDMEDNRGYAKEITPELLQEQRRELEQHVVQSNIVICTALVFGRKAPILVTKDLVEKMRPGSVIVDLAVEMGGNCELSQRGSIVDHHGVKIVGFDNLASQVAIHASELYARNILEFVTVLMKEVNTETRWKDEVLVQSLVLDRGQLITR